MDMEARIEQLRVEIDRTHDAEAIRKCTDLQDRFRLLDGYSYRKEYETAIHRFGFTPEEREKEGIGTLPESLFEAIQLTEKSELVRKTLGDHVFFNLIENKKIEWEKYRIQITQYELEEYLPVL